MLHVRKFETGTYTKKNLVQTWSGLGHTQMFALFRSSDDVITAKYNKIAFQYDAYRPLVDRISQHALHRGVMSAPRGGVCSGVPLPGVGWVSQHALRQTPTVDRILDTRF